MAHRAMPQRARRALGRIFRPTTRHPRVTPTRPQAPLWVRGLTAGGRPVVLGVALLMCAPGEYHLARAAGWSQEFAYGMPVVLSAYAGIAAAVASTRRKGDRGLWSAVIGACLALGLAMAAQVVSHLIGTGHVRASQPWLIAITSLVPPAVVGHLLHLAATPPDAHQDVPDAEDADRTLELEAGTDRDAEDGPPPEPPLMTSAQVADHYGIKPSTVRSWVALERIPVHSKDASGRNLFHPDQLPDFQVGVPA